MRRVVVRGPPMGSPGSATARGRCKGFVLGGGEGEGGIGTLEGLRARLREEFGCAVDGVGVAVGDAGAGVGAGGGVEVADMDFVRDGDVLFIIGDNPEEKIASVEKGVAADLGADLVPLNVGGVSFLTSRSTVQAKAPESMLARMLAAEDGGKMSAGRRDSQGALVLDRSPEYFKPVLNFLRTGKVILDEGVNPEGVYEEARYYGVEELLAPLLDLMRQPRWRRMRPGGDPEGEEEEARRPLTRREVVAATLSTPTGRELRFQGVDMAGADLSRLDLRHVNFKYANLKGCNLSGANLSWCCLERADLSGARLDGAQMLGIRMLCANLEGASLKGCNFDDPAGSNAIMEGVNLRNAVLEGSNMARVNLRVATVKRGNLKNCDLRAAVLAGADLEFCNLSGSDLGEANLRGANLKDTTLELMQTPLHMSQTIR